MPYAWIIVEPRGRPPITTSQPWASPTPGYAEPDVGPTGVGVEDVQRAHTVRGLDVDVDEGRPRRGVAVERPAVEADPPAASRRRDVEAADRLVAVGRTGAHLGPARDVWVRVDGVGAVRAQLEVEMRTAATAGRVSVPGLAERPDPLPAGHALVESDVDAVEVAVVVAGAAVATDGDGVAPPARVARIVRVPPVDDTALDGDQRRARARGREAVDAGVRAAAAARIAVGVRARRARVGDREHVRRGHRGVDRVNQRCGRDHGGDTEHGEQRPSHMGPQVETVSHAGIVLDDRRFRMGALDSTFAVGPAGGAAEAAPGWPRR